MTPGYYRITLRRATRCHHCGAPLPAHAAAWWRPRPAVHERTLCEACYTAHDLMLKAQRERDELKADSEQGIHPAERQLAEARALLRAVAESGVEWLGRDYVLVQIDRATWSAITAKPAPSPAPAVLE